MLLLLSRFSVFLFAFVFVCLFFVCLGFFNHCAHTFVFLIYYGNPNSPPTVQIDELLARDARPEGLPSKLTGSKEGFAL